MDHQSGNITGLFMAEETEINVLSATPKWFEREPNSYADFGGAFESHLGVALGEDAIILAGDLLVLPGDPAKAGEEQILDCGEIDAEAKLAETISPAMPFLKARAIMRRHVRKEMRRRGFSQ